MKRTAVSLFASLVAVAASATGASAISVGDSVVSGGYRFSVATCLDGDSGPDCDSSESGTLVAAADGIGFDVVFEPLDATNATGRAVSRDITIQFSVKSAGADLADLSSDTLRVYGTVGGSPDDFFGAGFNLTEQILVDGMFHVQGAVDGYNTTDGVVETVINFVVGSGQTLMLEKDLGLFADVNGSYVQIRKYSQRFNETISAVPLPAPFMLLLAAISGLGFMGVRRRAA